MFKNSYILNFILWIFRCIRSSYVFYIAEKCVEGIAVCYDRSYLKMILCGKGEIERYANTSVLYKFINKTFSLILGAAQKISYCARHGAAVKLINTLKSRSVILDNVISIPFLCCLIFLIPHDYWNNMYAMALAVIIFAFSAMLLPKEKKFSPVIWFTMVLFAAALVISSVISYNRGDSLRVLMFFVTSYLLCIGVYIYAYDEERLKKLAKCMLLTVVITALIAFAQRAAGIEQDASLTDLTLNEGMPGRVYSTMGNPNNYAEFLVLFLPFAFAYLLSLENKREKLICMICAAIAVGALILTYSRSGWIAFALSAFVFVALYNKKYLPYFILFALLAVPLLPQSVLNRILTIGNLNDTSSSYRLDIWSGCIKMIRDYWTTGVGLGSGGFAKIFPMYGVGVTVIAPHSHMQFMEMLIELGIMGFILYTCFTFVIIRRSFIAGKSKNYVLKNFAIAAAAAMTGIILIGFFEYYWFYPRVMFAFFVCIGACMAAVRLTKEK